MSDKKVSDELFLTKDEVNKTIEILGQSVAEINRITAQRDQLLEALKGVVRVADRATDEFDAARSAIAAVEQSK